jgi:hypothetical protein
LFLQRRAISLELEAHRSRRRLRRGGATRTEIASRAA